MGYLRTNSTLVDTSKAITSEGAYIWYVWSNTDQKAPYQFVASDSLSTYPLKGEQNGNYYEIYNLPKGLSNYTWPELQALCKAGLADSAVSINDKRTLTSAYFSSTTARVIDVSPQQITLAMYIPKTVSMISIHEVQGWLNTGVLNSFNETSFKASIKPSETVCGYDKYGAKIALDDAYKYLWLFTEIELWGQQTYGSVSDGVQFAGFKQSHTNTEVGAQYWLISPVNYRRYNVDGWCYSTTSGSPNYTTAYTTDSLGCFVGFYIG